MTTELEKQEEQLSILANKAECGLIKIAYNSEMTLLYANPYFYTLHGYTQEEYTKLFGTNALARIHPDDAQRFKASVARQLNMGTALRFEYRIIKKDGTISWLLIKGQMTATEQRIAYLCSCIDITSMKVSYQDLAKSKQELDVISNSVPGGVAKIRATDFKLLYANNTYFEIAGYSRLEYEEKFDNICIGLVLPEDATKLQEKVQKALREHSPFTAEYRIMHKSGQIRWSHLHATLMEDTDGSPIFLCVIINNTIQKQYQRELEFFHEKSQILAELTNERLWEYDVRTNVMQRSGKLDASFSLDETIPDFLNYIQDSKVIHVDDQNTFLNAFQFSRNTKKNIKLEIRMKNNIGIYIWYRMQGIVMYDDTGNPYQVIGKTIDIDASKQQYLKLQEETTHDNLTQLFNTNTLSTKINAILQEKLPSQEATLLFLDLDRFKILVDHYGQLAADEILSKTALLLHDTFPGQIIGRVGNDQFVVFLSDTNNLEEIDQKAEAVCQHVREMKIDAVDDVHVTCSIGYFSTKASDFTFEIMLLRANVAVRAMKSKGGNGCELYGSLKHSYSITNEAIDNQKRNYYDRLTGLYSLPAFILEGETQMDQKQDKKIAIVYFDINSFRIFNANYGFTIGNKILKYFARVLEEEKRENEMCCHVEKDEFVCMLYYDTAQDLALRFTDMKTHFSATNMNIEDYFRLNFTCGVYFSTGEREDLASMIDKANYARKATKGVTEVSHYAVYNGDTEKKAKKQLAIEASIEQAMKNEEIVPFFQPQYSLHTEQMVGIEALARWKTTDGTSLLPEDFFPVLEENGFIVELDFYIIEQTLKIFKSWMEKGLPLFPVSFNISGSHLLTTNFVERLVALMTQYSVPINYLELEISEKVFVTSPETTVFLVQELKDLGFKIILDDFGREFSAINSLKDLDIDGIKLDTAFFNGKIRKEKERIIFKKIIEMAKELKLSVSSEGVETTLQAEQLKDFGCDFAQGFLFHNPMSATEFEEYILTRMKP